MDEAESYSSSIIPFFTEAYKSKTLKELFLKLQYQKQKDQFSTDFAEGFPPPLSLVYCSLESEMFPYEYELDGKKAEYVHYSFTQNIETLCERNYLFLQQMTLLQYQKLINWLLAPEKLNKGKILAMWYFTTLLQDKVKNKLAGEMMRCFNEKVEGLSTQ